MRRPTPILLLLLACVSIASAEEKAPDQWSQELSYLPAQEYFDRSDPQWAVVDDTSTSYLESEFNEPIQEALLAVWKPINWAVSGLHFKYFLPEYRDEVEYLKKAYESQVKQVAEMKTSDMKKAQLAQDAILFHRIQDLDGNLLGLNSFEADLFWGKFECRDLAGWLVDTIGRMELKNLRAKRIFSSWSIRGGHSWVRMEVRDPKQKIWTQFDVDPIQYEQFSPLAPRRAD